MERQVRIWRARLYKRGKLPSCGNFLLLERGKDSWGQSRGKGTCLKSVLGWRERRSACLRGLIDIHFELSKSGLMIGVVLRDILDGNGCCFITDCVEAQAVVSVSVSC